MIGRPPARVGRIVAATLLASGLAGAAPGAVQTVSAQSPPTITTPFPSVSVQPASTASLPLTVSSADAERVDLAVSGAPDGWRATLSGGGNEVQSVYTTPDAPAELTLDVQVPADAADGTTTLTVTGTSGGGASTLEVDLNVAQAAGGTASITSDFPSLRGTADQTFTFSLQLANDTPQQLTFALQAQGPPGWEVTVEPTGQTTAASVAVDARGSQGLTLTAVPPVDVAAGSYELQVDATSGSQSAAAQLSVDVTGSIQMALTTPDERLNTTANAGSAQDFQIVVQNTGSSPLEAVQLTGTGPTDWTITFDPAIVDAVAPLEATTATARITPSPDAIAGDYVVTLQGASGDTTESIEIRVTVETPPIWGIVGALLIIGTLGAMFWVFRRYGRR